MRIAYWLKDLDTEAVLRSKRTERLRRACPNMPDDPAQRWMSYRHPEGGTLYVYPQGDGAALPVTAFGPPRPTFDGMVYYPPIDPSFEPEDLIKPEIARPEGAWYSTVSGKSLWIPLATATPRQVLLRAGGGVKFGDFQNEFGQLAHELFLEMQSDVIRFNDERLGRLLTLAIQGAYLVTDEMLEDCVGWLCTQDLTPITYLIFGIDPKASAAAPAGSPSADPATQTSP